ncbi:MAG: SMP-30/gluconolactonase/LRE family protein [Rudaea sp.]|uniref:InlB B-repeat-containing protein n=1 Tax=Rudaea sp. TaxID=2136325 RepID=UPI0039E5B9F4
MYKYPCGAVLSLITAWAQAAAPVITSQPASAAVSQGLTATLSVQATGATDYEWESSTDGGVNWHYIVGGSGNAASYTTGAKQLADNGVQYRVKVTNADGTTTSSAAVLTIQPWTAELLTATVASPHALALDASGATLYAAVGDSVFKIDTTLGGGANVTPGQPMNATVGLALAQDGTLYVSDHHRINKIAPNAATYDTWTGSTASGYADSPAAPLFNTPASIALDGAGNLFVADLENFRVRKVAVDGTVSTLAGDGTQAFQDGVGTAAKMARPNGLAITRDGSALYDTDTDSPCLRKIDVASATVSTVLGDCANGNAGAGVVDGTASSAKLGYSYGVAVDAGNDVFLTHYWDGVVRVVTAAGEISTLRDSTGTALTFSGPVGVAVAGDGTVYVGASNSWQIFKLTAAAAPAQFSIAASVTPAGAGTFTSCPATAAAGSTVTCTVSANAGYVFSGFSGCDSVNGTACTLSNIAAVRSITASFNAVPASTAALKPAPLFGLQALCLLATLAALLGLGTLRPR